MKTVPRCVRIDRERLGEKMEKLKDKLDRRRKKGNKRLMATSEYLSQQTGGTVQAPTNSVAGTSDGGTLAHHRTGAAGPAVQRDHNNNSYSGKVGSNRRPVSRAPAQPAGAAAAAAAPPRLPLGGQQLYPVPPLPDIYCPPGLQEGLKQPPPKPSVKLSRVRAGFVLSWNMAYPADCADIVTYELWTWVRMNPPAPKWLKSGTVRALPLPMACTMLMMPGVFQTSYFAVRAIDCRGRSGPFSSPVFFTWTRPLLDVRALAGA